MHRSCVVTACSVVVMLDVSAKQYTLHPYLPPSSESKGKGKRGFV